MPGLLPDWRIKQLVELQGMIYPFIEKQEQLGGFDEFSDKVISFGLSSYGYDMRVAGEFKIFNNANYGIIDPKDFMESASVIKSMGMPVVIPPNSFALACSVEYFKIPRNIMCLCIGKSTYARCGVLVNVTAFEPEWKGYVTIEISNTTPLPVRIYPFEGIAQVLFFEVEKECAVSYADKKGKYQDQYGITLPIV